MTEWQTATNERTALNENTCASRAVWPQSHPSLVAVSRLVQHCPCTRDSWRQWCCTSWSTEAKGTKSRVRISQLFDLLPSMNTDCTCPHVRPPTCAACSLWGHQKYWMLAGTTFCSLTSSRRLSRNCTMPSTPPSQEAARRSKRMSQQGPNRGFPARGAAKGFNRKCKWQVHCAPCPRLARHQKHWGFWLHRPHPAKQPETRGTRGVLQWCGAAACIVCTKSWPQWMASECGCLGPCTQTLKGMRVARSI